LTNNITMIQKQYLEKAQLIVSGVFVFLLPLDFKVLPPIIGVLALIGLIQFNKTVFLNNMAKYKPYYIFFVLFFLWLLVSLIWTNDISKGLKAIEHRGFYLVAPLLFLLFEKWPVNKLIKIFILSNFLICLYCFTMLFPFFIYEKWYFIDRTAREGITFDTLSYISYHSGANFISFGVHRLYFSFSIISSLLFLAFHKHIFTNKILKYIMLVLFILVVLLLQSKMSVILFSVLLLYSFVKILRSSSTKKRIIISVSFILILSIGFYLTRIRFNQFINQIDVVAESERGSLVERYQYTKCSLELIKEAPIFGYGAGDFGAVMEGKLKKYNFTYLLNKGVFDPHNEFLKSYIGMGIVGFLFFLGAFLSIFYRLSFEKNNVLFFYVGFVFIICLIEPFLSRQAGILPTLFFIGLLVDGNRKTVEYDGHTQTV